jgi:hypothetical protein
VHTTAEQVSGGTHLGRIDIGHGDHASSDDTEVHILGVEINSTEKFVLLGVKSHTRPPLGNIFWVLNLTPNGYDSRGP